MTIEHQQADKIQIRRTAPAEASLIANLLRRAFAEYESFYPADSFAETIATPNEIEERIERELVWVAVKQKQIIGTVGAARRDDYLYLKSLAVDPPARGALVGRQLLETVESFAVTNNFKQIYLNTAPYLTSALRLYQEFGFVAAGEIHLIGGMPLFKMCKTLPAF